MPSEAKIAVTGNFSEAGDGHSFEHRDQHDGGNCERVLQRQGNQRSPYRYDLCNRVMVGNTEKRGGAHPLF